MLFCVRTMKHTAKTRLNPKLLRHHVSNGQKKTEFNSYPALVISFV